MKKVENTPRALKNKYKHRLHDDDRIDNYFWLKERDNPEVIKYLNQENNYYKKMTKNQKGFEDKLFDEMKLRINRDEVSVPYFYNGYWYLTKFKKGQEYPIYLRKKLNLKAKEEVLFDCNIMSKDYKYFDLGSISISPNNKMAAFSVDTVSRRLYSIMVKDLETGRIFDFELKGTSGSCVWSNDSKYIFYSTKNIETLRSESIKRFDLENSSQKNIYEEVDLTFSVNVSKSKSNEFIFINSYSTLTTETRFLNSKDPLGEFKIFQRRIKNLEYYVFHFNDFFYLLTNSDNSFNFKIVKTPIDNTEKENWITFFQHKKKSLIEDFDVFKKYYVLTFRTRGLNSLNIFKWNNNERYSLPINNKTYTLSTSSNLDFNTHKLRYNYSSLTEPFSVREINMKTKKNKILKEQKIYGGSFNKNNYISKRIWATGHDNVKIPISIVFNKKYKLSSKTPLLIYGYGSYGHTIDPNFSSLRLSLLDRGFAFAIAHVRGSEYLGRKWYEEGKLLKKRNTFYDFISCSEYLIEINYTSKKHLYAYGGSAGGLLMGAVVNMRPDLYNGVILAVPFVDVVTTMLDKDIPLTTSEYDEWGDPNNKEFYNYIKSYSPYDNLRNKRYPNIFVTSGFYDSQVQYWEPTKWVAKLREMEKNDSLLLYNINMSTGHSGSSGRFDFLKEKAKEYSFLLSLENNNK